MDLKTFATKCGMKIVECSPECGGRVGYTTEDHPNCTIGGFRTENAAINHWFADTFGAKAGPIVRKLLTKPDR